MVISFGSLVQSCCEEGGTMPTNITGMCGECCSISATLGLPPLTACVLYQSTLLRLQVALQGNCLKWGLDCMRFPGLSHSGSGSRVLDKGTDSFGLAFCALPRSEQLRRPGAWWAHTSQVRCVLSPLPSQCSVSSAQWERHLRCAMCLFSGAYLWLQLSQWMSTVQDPRKTWLTTGSLLTVW